jgi:hypothetical protein
MQARSIRTWRSVALLAAVPFLVHGRPAGAALGEGDVLSEKNWEAARGLLPAPVLEHYRRGDYANRIIDVAAPGLEGVQLPEPLREASRANHGRYRLGERGTILDAGTGAPPTHLVGLPFPDVEPNDPDAAIKVIWNYFLVQWYRGDTRLTTDVTMINRSGIERAIRTDVVMRMYQGAPEHLERANPLDLFSQTLARVTSPNDLSGIVSLSWRYRRGDRHDSTWSYIPGLRHVRAIDPLNRSDGFLGSDLSLDDGAFFDGKPEDFTFRLVGREEQLVLFDPYALRRDYDVRPLNGAGWRVVWKDVPRIGLDDPGWQGAAWAPIGAALGRRPVWIVEARPRDPNYLYDRIELRLDAETYMGAWVSKYDRAGQLVVLYAVGRSGYHPVGSDGVYVPAGGVIVQVAENLAFDRATAVLFKRGDPEHPSDFRVETDAGDFDSITLVKHGR